MPFPMMSAVVLFLAACSSNALELANCTQQVVSLSGARTGSSVKGRYALFMLSAHSDDPNSGHVDVYDIESKTWSETHLSTSRTNACSTSWEHLAIFAGGATGRGQPKSRSIDIWDSSTGKWSLRQLTIGRDLLACASSGDYTIFAGGSAPQVNQSETASVELWNHRTGGWSTAKRSQPRKKPEAVTVGTKIVIAGGEIAKPPHTLRGYSATIDIFDTQTGVWTTDKLPGDGRQYFGAAQASGTHIGAGPAGVAVFAGGFYDDERLGQVDMYDPFSAKHYDIAHLSHNRSNLHGISVNGRYAAFGSGNIDPIAKTRLDFFDGETGEWGNLTGHSSCVSCGLATVGKAVLFMGTDGKADVVALDGNCSGFE